MSRLGLSLRSGARGSYEVGGSIGQAANCLRLLDELEAAALDSEIIAWLGELSTITTPRNRSDFDGEITIRAYLSRLRQHPRDAVYQTLMVERWKFWPTVSELLEVIDKLTRDRKAMRAALLDADKPRTTDQDRVPVTAERAAQIMAEAGFTPERIAAVQAGRANQAAKTYRPEDYVDDPALAAAMRRVQEAGQ